MLLLPTLIPSLIFIGGVLAAILFCRKRIGHDFWVLTFITLAYACLLNLPRLYPAFRFIDSPWNWSGKIMAVLFSLVCLLVFKNRLPLKQVGLTRRFKPHSFEPALVFTMAYLAVICIGSFFFQGQITHAMSKADIIWNTTILPDFSEELMERGILLVLLNRIFGKSRLFFGAQVGLGLILICLLFGLEHGFFVNADYHVRFIPFHFFRAAIISALAFTWLKERTGNLIFPTIAHFGSELILTLVIVLFL